MQPILRPKTQKIAIVNKIGTEIKHASQNIKKTEIKAVFAVNW
jgi:hypothetical protein